MHDKRDDMQLEPDPTFGPGEVYLDGKLIGTCEVLSDETCRAIAEGKLVPQNATPAEHEQARAALIAAVTAPKPPRKMSIDELQGLLERDSDVPLQILPNGEIREADTGERTERKPLTMRDNLGGEYSAPDFKLEDPYAPPPVIGAQLPPQSRHRRLFATPYAAHQVMAIAALLAAENPGMFAGPDVLGPVVMPPLPPLPPRVSDFEQGLARHIAAESHVVVADRPAVPSRKIPSREARGGKPAGTKLARKAARGRL